MTPVSTPGMMMQRAMPMLQTAHIRAALPFYARLGFQPMGVWDEDDPVFAIVQRGHITLGVARSEAPPDMGRWSSAFLYVEDVDALYEEYRAKGIETDSPPEDRPYGCRDFELRTPDGHWIVFAQDVASSYGPGLDEALV